MTTNDPELSQLEAKGNDLLVDIERIGQLALSIIVIKDARITELCKRVIALEVEVERLTKPT
jgi:hypothetical protein